METMKKLNTSDGWENIVNSNYIQRASARERVAVWKRERKLRKLQIATTVLGVACIGTVILGATGAVAHWLATAIAVVSLVCASILFGRYLEAKKG